VHEAPLLAPSRKGVARLARSRAAWDRAGARFA
jgi:hypothetical protein